MGRRAQLSPSWQQGPSPPPLHPHPAGGSPPQGTLLAPVLSLCPTSILGCSQPFSHGKPLTVPRHGGRRGVRGHSATSTWMTAGTSLMLPGELSGGDMGSSGIMEPAPTHVQCYPTLEGRRGLIATMGVTSVPLALHSPHRFVLGQPLGDVEVVDLGGDLLPVPRLGDPNGREVLGQRGGSVPPCSGRASLPPPPAPPPASSG